MPESISALDTLDNLIGGQMRWCDVRSEGEFHTASIPGFVNIPILRDSERHQVGLCYRQHGQSAAIELGKRLVETDRMHRVLGWLGSGVGSFPVGICCWRGGLRSQFAAKWVEDAGKSAVYVHGGYKALRNELLRIIHHPHQFIVLTGFTGSGKSDLLKCFLPNQVVSLETLAAHRGSSFGSFRNVDQPSQVNFENALGLHLRGVVDCPLIEDESRVIGSLYLPEAIYRSLLQSPVVRILASIPERCLRIYSEYVEIRLRSGEDCNLVKDDLIQSTFKLKKRLGGFLTSQVTAGIIRAMDTDDVQAHHDWISLLLTNYYDPMYKYADSKSQRQVLFQGSQKECQIWIKNQYV